MGESWVRGTALEPRGMWVGISVGVRWKRQDEASKKGIGPDFDHPLQPKTPCETRWIETEQTRARRVWDENGSRSPEMEQEQHVRETGGGRASQAGEAAR